MLVHLSSTSPYICDTSLGPIEQANRMSSVPAKKSFLEPKESFPRLQLTRTPLKLLAFEEVPMDTSVSTTTTDINASRQQSLQPVWYTEQTIVDDNIEQQQQQRNSVKSPNHRLDLTRSTLPTIESNSPEIEDEIIEKQPLSTKSSLIRKSSTFTIERQPSINIPSSLNESEKENDLNTIITSTQEESTNPIRHPTEPSDESFRALEHLLGLGSTNTNLTMTTTAQESPKSNHESLSLTIVTPTELINQTTNSLHLSYAPAGGGSLPSSQNILLMPTIESITEPSMNSTIPPPFLVDNSDLEEPSSNGGTVIDQEIQNEESFHFTDDNTTTEEEEEEENNFSFELNDFSSNSKDETAPPMITIRPPTSADVAYRALIKSRTSGRKSQSIKTESPLAKTLSTHLSVPTNLTSRVLRSSTHRISTDPIQQNEISQSIPDDQCFVNENKLDDDYPRIELVEVVSLSEDEEMEPEQNGEITLNLTTSPTSAEEADRSASSSCSSYISTEQDITTTPTDPKMPILSREFTYNTPTSRVTRSSERRRSILINPPSQPLIPEEENVSIYSIPSSSSAKSTLSTLSTNPTVISEAPPIILQKSLAGSASPSPNPTPIITIRRQSERLSSNLSPRRNINPIYSSTPSIRNKSLQIVSIGEQEQVSTTVPKQLNINLSNEDVEMIDNEQQIDIRIPILNVIDECIQTSPEKSPLRIDIGIQTTPSLNPLSHRRFQTMEQQTTPIVTRSSSSSSCQTTPVVIAIQRSNSQQTSPIVQTSSKMIIEEQEQQQVTPLHSKAIMHLRRNVRFQFTPSTDARLAAKEKLEEEQKRLKQDIVINNIKQILSDNEREEDTEDEITKTKKKISTSKKKKILPPTPVDDSSEEMNESPIRRTTRNQLRKDTNDTDVTSTTHSKTKTSKRSVRHEKKIEPHPEPVEIIITTTSPPLPTKRANRKRSNPKTSTTSPSETTSPTEPVIKRPKTIKTVEVKQPVRNPSPEPLSTRSRSKTPIISNDTVSLPETIERPPIPKKVKKISVESNSNEQSAVPVNSKRKNSVSTIRKGKRRLHSVEQDEGLNTADEEETIPPPDEVIPINLSQEEREKIEGLTVAELKNRLNTHGENIPKGARKADLVVLLIKIETNLLKERKKAETVAVPVDPPSRNTRRKK